MDALKIFGGVLVGWILSQLTDWRKRNREKKADAAYLAASVLIALDRLISGCAEVAGDEGTSYGRPAGRTEDGEEYYIPQKPIPKLSWDGLKVEWKSIEPNLMYSILSIPLELAEAEDYLEGVAEHDDPPHDGYISARQIRFAELGVMVTEIARKLRFEAGIPARPTKEWNAESYLRRRLQVLQEREAKRLATQNTFWSTVGTNETTPPPES